MPLYIIYNPVCGSKEAVPFFKEHVLPLLNRNKFPYHGIFVTARVGHAGEIVSELITTAEASGEDTEGTTIDIILGSGDGTLHEIINALYNRRAGCTSASDCQAPKIRIVLVPCGTANALYSSLFPPSAAQQDGSNVSTSVEYKLQAVNAYITSKTGATVFRPLVSSATTLFDNGGRRVQSPLISSVVVSTALHAAILRDSEKLRAEMPGIERFKVAAHQNASIWADARVELLPLADGSPPQIYDPTSHSFTSFLADSGEAASESKNNSHILIPGPFSYFLSTTNVDRLEPTFVVTPLANPDRGLPPPLGTCEIVIVRPLRSPPAAASTNNGGQDAFVPKLWGVMGAAYDQGAHIRMRYSSEGALTTEGEGPPIVEYIRCGGWKWIPNPTDPNAHWVCSDGYVTELPQGGVAECRVLAGGGEPQVWVCAPRGEGP